MLKQLPWQADIAGQLLTRREHLPHAMLLHGIKGIGKREFAQQFAQSLLCESPLESGLACDKCLACGWFAQGNHPDFRIIQPQEATTESADEEVKPKAKAVSKKSTVTITVGQIRELADFVNISSHRNGPKVVVLHPAEAMNTQAANALLKTLEEPPANMYFLLVTHQAQRLLATLRSRCRQVAMPVPEIDVVSKWLSEQGLTDTPMLYLAQAGYAPLAALALHEAQDEAGRKKFIQHLANPAALDIFSLTDFLQAYKIEQWMSWLINWVYDLISTKMLGKARYNIDSSAMLERTVASVRILDVIRFYRQLLALQPVLHHPLNQRLLTEQLLINYTQIKFAS